MTAGAERLCGGIAANLFELEFMMTSQEACIDETED